MNKIITSNQRIEVISLLNMVPPRRYGSQKQSSVQIKECLDDQIKLAVA